MLDTFTPQQLEAAGLIAPGTLALRDASLSEATFLTTTDDYERSGIWMLVIQANGDTAIHLRHRTTPKLVTLAALRAATDDARAETAAGV